MQIPENVDSSFLSEEELVKCNFKRIGKGVKISKYARFYGCENIEIGDFSRIDDFCIISGYVTIGRYSHISAYSALYGKMKIEIGDFSGVQESADCVKENKWTLMNSIKFNEVDWTIVVKKEKPLVEKDKTEENKEEDKED